MDSAPISGCIRVSQRFHTSVKNTYMMSIYIVPCEVIQNTCPASQESGISFTHQRFRLLCFVADTSQQHLSGGLVLRPGTLHSHVWRLYTTHHITSISWATDITRVTLKLRIISEEHVPRDVKFLVYSLLTSTRGRDMLHSPSVTVTCYLIFDSDAWQLHM